MTELTSEEVGLLMLTKSLIEEAFEQRIQTLKDFQRLTWKLEENELDDLIQKEIEIRDNCFKLISKIKQFLCTKSKKFIIIS